MRIKRLLFTVILLLLPLRLYADGFDSPSGFDTGTELPSLTIKSGGDITLSGTSQLLLPQNNDAANPTIMFGTGCGLYGITNTQLGFSSNGLGRFKLNGTDFEGLNVSAPRLQNATPTSTNPNFHPNKSDDDTGYTWVEEDKLGITSGGTSTHHFYFPSTGSETGFVLYDLVTGGTQTVTTGLTNTGGAGFRALRVPN